MALLTLYYDGRCAFCVRSMQQLKAWDGGRHLAFADIKEPGFDPAFLGADMAALNRELHGRTAAGEVLMRTWMIRWLFAVSAGHVLVGLLLPWAANAALLNGYHTGIEAAFWPAGAAPLGARGLQTWWISLFGPTVQLMALWMIALIHLAGRLRQARIWLWLIVGLVLWAPQDMLVSLRADCWPHVWTDAFALALMLPPLFWLWRHDGAVTAPRVAA